MLLAVTAACSTNPPTVPPTLGQGDPTFAPTSLSRYDTSLISIVRAAFCDRVSGDAISAALSGEPEGEQSWRPGGPLPGSKAISNEFGCAWTSGDVRARAWVFAPPVTTERAVDLAVEVVDERCEPVQPVPDLGEPSAIQRCEDSSTRTSIHGLVGDAWVSCEISGLTGGASVDTQLVSEWCVAVLEALRGT